MFIRLKEIDTLLGKLSFEKNSYPGFEKLIIDFLDSIYLSLNINKKNYIYSDLMTFGFWCRKQNLIKLENNYKNKYLLLGRGTILHITPSNIPMNFAYSLAFGLLSGNSNIVRLPERNFDQVKILCRIIKRVLDRKKFQILKKRICLIRYKRSDKISSMLSNEVDARMIWGGDNTISNFKKYKTQPRCIDLCFSNRYSLSVINIAKFKKLNTSEIKNLANRFYNDAYLMDQQGCSSPQALIWIGKEGENQKNFFWKSLKDLVDKNYKHDLSVASKKISSVTELAIKSKFNFKTNLSNFKIIKINIKNPSRNLEEIQCHFGSFTELSFKKVDDLKKIITKKFQTLTIYGFDNQELEKFIIKSGVNGIDRIVPIGRAFDMGHIWDAYDIINTLARVVVK